MEDEDYESWLNKAKDFFKNVAGRELPEGDYSKEYKAGCHHRSVFYNVINKGKVGWPKYTFLKK